MRIWSGREYGRNMNKEIVFLSGKYRGDIQQNINKARLVSQKLWQQGFIVICPHLNTANFDGICPDDIWLNGYLEILKRCDSIYMMKDWEQSQGAVKELSLAKELDKKVHYE
jgi:hypothetical protein